MNCENITDRYFKYDHIDINLTGSYNHIPHN